MGRALGVAHHTKKANSYELTEIQGCHIAVAAVHGMDVLLTWNCTHIHNIAISRQIERLCARAGWLCPAICTPFDLLEA
jgi:hypothetical protein